MEERSIDYYLSSFSKNEARLLEEFFTFLRFPSISAEPAYRDAMKSCAEWLSEYLKSAGLEVQMWETPGYPAVFASWLGAGPDKPTVLIYNHYDVQPVDPLELWITPPFEPVLEDGVIRARGAQDNKGQCFSIIAAVTRMLAERGSLPVNVKLIIEGDEERSSLGLAQVLEKHADDLRSDKLLVIDVGIHGPEDPSVTLGLRGITALTVEFEGSNTDLHSGNFGGIAYNPNRAAAEVLAKLHDETGRVTVPGFYDDVTTPAPAEIADVDFHFNAKQVAQAFALKATGGERGYEPLKACWLRPTLEINGISGGYAGPGFKTVIPAKTTAKISCRLVPNQDPNKIGELVANYIKSLAPDGIRVSANVHAGTGTALRTGANSALVQAVAQAFAEIFKKPCRFIMDGASIPIVPELSRVSKTEVVLFGYGLPTDKIHAPNEEFSVDRLAKGYATISRVLDLLGR